MRNERQLYASVSLPLPVDPRPAKILQAILEGGEGELSGCEVWTLLTSNIKKMPMAKPQGAFTYNAWVLYLREGDKVVAQEVRSAERCSAEMIRKIVAIGETCGKNLRLKEEDSLPAPTELADLLTTTAE